MLVSTLILTLFCFLQFANCSHCAISCYIKVSRVLANFFKLLQTFYGLECFMFLVLSVYIVFLVLLLFQCLHGQVTFNTYNIYSIYFIISIYFLRTICEHCSQYFILLINDYYTLFEKYGQYFSPVFSNTHFYYFLFFLEFVFSVNYSYS